MIQFDTLSQLGYVAGDALALLGAFGSLLVFAISLFGGTKLQVPEQSWTWIGIGIGLGATVYLGLLVNGMESPFSPLLGLHYVTMGAILFASSMLLFCGEMVRRNQVEQFVALQES